MTGVKSILLKGLLLAYEHSLVRFLFFFLQEIHIFCEYIGKGVIRMKTKKRIVISFAIVLAAAALLFPFGSHLRDGGTVVYEPITKMYRIDKLHALTDGSDRQYGEFYVGTVIYIFGQKVYNDIRIVSEN